MWTLYSIALVTYLFLRILGNVFIAAEICESQGKITLDVFLLVHNFIFSHRIGINFGRFFSAFSNSWSSPTAHRDRIEGTVQYNRSLRLREYTCTDFEDCLILGTSGLPDSRFPRRGVTVPIPLWGYESKALWELGGIDFGLGNTPWPAPRLKEFKKRLHVYSFCKFVNFRWWSRFYLCLYCWPGNFETDRDSS